jgi:hypothetical protein
MENGIMVLFVLADPAELLGVFVGNIQQQAAIYLYKTIRTPEISVLLTTVALRSSLTVINTEKV